MPCSVTDTKCNLTSFAIPCENIWAVCIYNVPITVTYESVFSTEFQSSMITSHYKNVRKQNIPKLEELEVCLMTIIVNSLIRSVIQKLAIMKYILDDTKHNI